jgi:hypothetical protein
MVRGAVAFGTVENALYYTFSTIAQALAAAMTLLAAFAMYRLNAIDEESRGAAFLIESGTGGGVPLRTHYLLSHWDKCIEAASSRIAATGAGPEMVALREKIRQLRNTAHALRRVLWIALIATALVMTGSVEVLAYVPSICVAGLARQTLGWGGAGFAICLLTYCWLVWQAFRTTKE